MCAGISPPFAQSVPDHKNNADSKAGNEGEQDKDVPVIIVVPKPKELRARC